MSRLPVVALLLTFTAFSTAFASRKPAAPEPLSSPVAPVPGGQTLSAIMKANLLGLDLEPEQERKATLERARYFATLLKKKNPSDPGARALLKECEEDRTRHAYCAFLEGSPEFNFGKSQVSARRRKSREDLRRVAKVREWLKAGDLAQLQGAQPDDLREAVKSVRSSDALAKVTENVLAASTCLPSALGFALASRAEEQLPKEGAYEKVHGLYAAAAKCGDDEPAIRSMYRLSLFNIWRDRCGEALPHLEALAGGLGNNDYRSRALYWKAHCAEKTGDPEAAVEARTALLNQHPFSLHTIIARRDEVTRMGSSLRPDSPAMLRSELRPELNSPVLAAEALLAIREPGYARKVLDTLSEVMEGSEPAFQLYVASLYSRLKDNIGKFRLLSPLFRDHSGLVSRSSLELYYPRREVNTGAIQAAGLDELLVLSLIRQESAFNENARSRAGARGLMQIMPATARRIERIPARKLFEPDHNVRIGSKYFSALLQRYEGDTELALAAYNAGPLRVDQWLKRYPIENRLLFLDLIPFKETREYVSSIGRNYFWYVMLYGNAPAPLPSPAAGLTANKEVFRIFKF
ncbi:MAG: lytic transglycosylase domain-containing protein [Oligoflexia bacterium]|nr:lytic transglycosylase domain-containing protein [Oligoflexia bacterium]